MLKMEPVKIGKLEWSKRNLDVVVDGSWDYDNDPANREKYGRLYTWDAAIKAVAMLGDGWRLPTREDWNYLIEAADGKDVATLLLKAKSPNWDGIDDFSFSALPGGIRHKIGDFLGIGFYGYWWVTAEDGNNNAHYRYMQTGVSYAFESSDDKGFGFSVRCVRDVQQLQTRNKLWKTVLSFVRCVRDAVNQPLLKRSENYEEPF